METFVGDTIRIILQTGIDLTGYTTLWIKYKKPDLSTGHWVATKDGTEDTWMYYDTLETDLDMPGIWTIQAYAESSRLHGLWANFQVHQPIPDTTVPPTTLAPTTAGP